MLALAVGVRREGGAGSALGTWSATHQVQLLVGGGEMDGRAGAVVLCDEVGIGVHDLGQLLGVAQPDGGVERDGRILGDGRVPARATWGAA